MEATGKGLKCWTCEEAAGHEGRRRASGSQGTVSHPDEMQLPVWLGSCCSVELVFPCLASLPLSEAPSEGIMR